MSKFPGLAPGAIQKKFCTDLEDQCLPIGWLKRGTGGNAHTSQTRDPQVAAKSALNHEYH